MTGPTDYVVKLLRAFEGAGWSPGREGSDFFAEYALDDQFQSVSFTFRAGIAEPEHSWRCSITSELLQQPVREGIVYLEAAKRVLSCRHLELAVEENVLVLSWLWKIPNYDKPEELVKYFDTVAPLMNLNMVELVMGIFLLRACENNPRQAEVLDGLIEQLGFGQSIKYAHCPQ